MVRRRKRTLKALPKKTKRSGKLIDIEKNTAREIWAVVFLALAFLIALSLGDKLARFGDYFSEVILELFGQGAYLTPAIFFFLSLAFFASKTIKFDFTRMLGVFLIFFGAMGFFHTFLPDSESMLEFSRDGGGYIGFAASILFVIYLGTIGARVILMGLFVIGILLTFPISIREIFASTLNAVASLFSSQPKKSLKSREKQQEVKVITPSFDAQEAQEKQKKFNKKAYKETKKEPEKPLIAKPDGDWEPPSLDLLLNEQTKIAINEKILMRQAETIREKLLEFGVDVEMGDVHTGPTVTQFTLRPTEGVKLTKITGLKSDLALALSAKSIRIEAPIPGRNLVGIEIPNEKRSIVRLREILEAEAFRKIKSNLRLALGRDVAGAAVALNLEEMPHLLMAGATGAGKSVGMNTFLLSLLFQNSPAQLKMIMIDPKRVELAPFNGIPHLLTPVITDADKALSALRWVVAEMMRRYTEMGDKGFRNITEYNRAEKEKMPKIVIVIDELADLMMRNLKKETESVICRIAQMARAVGMHLVIATQRPSVDVITGLIKANIPARISFAVTSSIDSRTILDSIGAEDLLGKGDMLLTNASLSKPLRVQGILVSPEEINRVINRIKLTGEPEFDESILQEKQGSSFSGDINSAEDALLEDAVKFVRESGKASASLLQRRLSIGYARAARILDIMEEQGMIGPARGAKPREIFL